MPGKWLWAASLSLVVATPAAAADAATLGCIEDGMSVALRTQIADDFEARFGSARRDPQNTFDAQLAAVGKQCRVKHGWSLEATIAALVWTRARIRLPIIEKHARGDGFDVDAIRKAWHALPEKTRTRELTEDSILRPVADAGGTRAPQGSFITGMFVATLNIVDVYRAKFIRG